MSTANVKLSPDKTWIPIGVAIGGLITLVTGAVWVSSSFQELAYSNKDLASALLRVEGVLDRLVADSVDAKELQSWIEVFRAQNPTLKVPDTPR